MARSAWKGLYLSRCLLNKKKYLKKKSIHIWNRNSAIPYFLIGKTVSIHNGKDFIKIFISREKVGYKFGEFVSTRKYVKKVSKTKKK